MVCIGILFFANTPFWKLEGYRCTDGVLSRYLSFITASSALLTELRKKTLAMLDMRSPMVSTTQMVMEWPRIFALPSSRITVACHRERVCVCG